MGFKIKIGDKCKIPKTKNVGERYDESYAIRKAKELNQDFLYYTGKSKGGDHRLYHIYDENDLTGDYFLEHEIELYEEEFPEKWCVLRNQDNFEILNKWANKKHGSCYTEGTERFIYCDTKTGETMILNGYTEITFDQFKKHILKESTTMKNLLETEFVIENCTLSQRLAIKAYCDEKKIKYWSENTCTNDKQNDIYWDREEFLSSKGSTNCDKITFSELIQFLDKYQPEPEFKVGDFVLLKDNAGGYGGYDMISKQIVKILEITNIESKRKYIRFIFNGESNTTIVEKIERHATPEEIKKWKEENEIKLPRINQYDGKVDRDFIIYGNNCAKLKISWFKNIGNVDSFLNIGENRTIRSIKLNSDVEITIAHIEQIKKFIEHNKL